MKTQGNVDSEGGPLLIGDAVALQNWSPDDFTKPDLDYIQQILVSKHGGSVPIEGYVGILWDCGGAGTTDVFSDENSTRVLLVRAWFDDVEEQGTLLLLSQLPSQFQETLGTFVVTTGWLAILWSAESGKCIQYTEDEGWSIDRRELTTDTSGMLLTLPNGSYHCLRDQVEIKNGEAWRCHIIKLPT